MSAHAQPAISDAQRRARLVDRHHLARTAPDIVDAARRLVALHCSEPATPYLSSWARVRRFRIDHLEDALYGERALWRLHAMRRTLFVVPIEDERGWAAVSLRGWAQQPGGEVVYRLLEDVGSEASAQVEEQAAALTAWLAGVVVIPRFRTPLERELTA